MNLTSALLPLQKIPSLRKLVFLSLSLEKIIEACKAIFRKFTNSCDSNDSGDSGSGDSGSGDSGDSGDSGAGTPHKSHKSQKSNKNEYEKRVDKDHEQFIRELKDAFNTEVIDVNMMCHELIKLVSLVLTLVVSYYFLVHKKNKV